MSKVLRLPALLAAVLLVLSTACSSTGDGPDPEQQLDMHREFALRYFDQGDLLRSEQQVDKGLEIDSKDRQMLLMKAWILQRRGGTRDIFLAEQMFRELIDGKDYRVELGLAEALERQGILYREASEAVASGKRFTEKLDPQARGVELLDKGHTAWEESRQHYLKALELKPGEFQAINGLQRVLALMGDDDGSLEWAERLLTDCGAEMQFWRERLRQRDLSVAEEARLRELLDGSIKLQVQTHLSAASLLIKQDRKEACLEHLNQAAMLAPDLAEIHSRRAQLLHDLGRNAEAAEAIQAYLSRANLPFEHPDIRRAYALLSACQAESASADALDS